jgi:hypothetical protein
MKRCFHCGNRLKISEKPTRDETCPFCNADLKTCLNCKSFDPSLSNNCSEPMAERVSDKEKANFCEYFLFRESAVEMKTAPVEDRLQDLKRLFTDAP